MSGTMVRDMLGRLLLSRGLARPMRVLGRGRVAFFMLHRFHDPDTGSEGHDPEALRRDLAYLRQAGYELLGVREAFRRLAGDGPPRGAAVVFTLDDGYEDQARVAAPVFAEFDCPATVFLTTGFLDGQSWQWWDRIEYVFRYTRRRQVQLALNGEQLDYCWSGAPERLRAQADFTAHCKRIGDAERQTAIARLAAAVDVDLPRAKAPAEYAPMSWEDVRRCEERGMEFGPHTVSHPILSRLSATEAEWEITESWSRVRTEARAPVAVMAYPNGGPGDFGPREVAILKRQGFAGALAGVPEDATPDAFGCAPDSHFRVPRFGYYGDLRHLVQCVSGLYHWRRQAAAALT